jgi:DNA-binding transcriptional ArsR family regulator
MAVNQSVDDLPIGTPADPVNHLVEEKMTRLAEEDRLDDVFHALANRTRRALLRSLAAGPARVTELAEPHGMSVNAISKHLFVLERAGLIRRARNGHVQSCVLDAAPMATADEWIGSYRRFWSGKIDRLAEFVEKRQD